MIIPINETDTDRILSSIAASCVVRHLEKLSGFLLEGCS